ELATHVWAIREGTLDDFRGSFVEWEALQAERERTRSAVAASAADATKAAEREKAKRAHASRETGDAARRDRKRKLETAERAATKAEETVRELEAALADQDLYSGGGEGARKAADLTRRLADAKKAFDRAMAEWSTLEGT